MHSNEEVLMSSLAVDRFPLAPMSRSIFVPTVIVLALPIGILVAGTWISSRLALVPSFLLGLIYLWVWVYFRPTYFDLSGDALRIV